MNEKLLSENVRLIIEKRELEKELHRIKGALKRGDTCLIIDGQDMTDMGWATHKDINEKIASGFFDKRVEEAKARRLEKIVYDVSTNTLTVHEK